MASSRTTVVVFVPGTTASELIDCQSFREPTTVWPDVMKSSLSQDEKAYYASTMLSKELTIGDIVSSFPQEQPVSVYADLIAYFTNGANFADGEPFTYFSASTERMASKPTGAPPSKLFFTTPYDWRLNNSDSAQYLASVLNYLDSMYSGWDYEIYLLAHSNGGLVSRYMLENMASAIADKTILAPTWWSKVQMLVTLATPHLGAPLAWKAITGQLGQSSVEIAFVQEIVDNNNFPSTFELLPPESHLFITDKSGTKQNIYSAESTSQLYKDMTQCHVKIDNLNTAATFFSGLLTDLRKAPIPYQFYYGSELPTLAVVGEEAKDAAFLYTPEAVAASAIFAPQIQNDAGDSIVPASSANFDGTTVITTQEFKTYNHGQMGGSDISGSGTSLSGHPDSILAAATAFGLDPVIPNS